MSQRLAAGCDGVAIDRVHPARLLWVQVIGDIESLDDAKAAFGPEAIGLRKAALPFGRCLDGRIDVGAQGAHDANAGNDDLISHDESLR
ncbi:protein of unknown function [Methylocaldum szegediense]|uniref:Uncharacterized protein n=1 Tax=Methylocaldum szegediense TaxID=73780 RepID=A0ABM9I7B6_9GAMM|nr:protein of unknown function [Methylocaldum szegediense]